MKRFLALIIFLAMAVILVPWLHPARAADQKVDVYENQKLVKSVVFKIGVPYYVVDGKTPGVKMDVAPFIQNNRTFVPVRFLGNALGVTNDNIAWDNGTQTATLKGAKATLSMTIGKPEVLSNGSARAIDVAPMLVDPGRTMLPARFVAEGLGYEVGWDEATQTVICWPQGQPKPDVTAAKQYLIEQAAKPEVVKGLEGLFGLPAHKNGSGWMYSPSKEEIYGNKEKSYFDFGTGSDGTIFVDVKWAKILSDIRNVELDLSPIEKVLNWKFPDQPGQVQEIMDYAWQVAEKTRSSNRTERLPWKDFYVNGYKVKVGSVGFNFVGVIISKT